MRRYPFFVLLVCALSLSLGCEGKNDCRMLIEERNYADGGFASGIVYTYSSDNRLLTKRRYWKPDTTNVGVLTEYTYNEAGTLLLQELEISGDSERRTTYSYDDNEKRLTKEVEGTHYEYDGEEWRYSATYTYDDSGKTLSTGFIIQTFPDGRVTEWSKTYSYDNDGNLLTEEHDKDDNGTVDWRITRTYDGNGNLLTEDWYYDGVVEESYAYTYDSNGNRLTQEFKRNRFQDEGIINYTYIWACD